MKTLTFNRIGIALIAILISTFLITSCQKENSLNNTTTVSETDAANLSDESTQAEGGFDDAEDIGFTAAEEEGNEGGFGVEGKTAQTGRPYFPRWLELRRRIGDCATITVTPNDTTYPKTVTIDFGDSCRGRDGKLRSGQIVLHFTGPIRRPGSVVTMTFVNYYVNRVHIEGVKIFTNLSEPPALHKWRVEVVNGRVTFPNGRGYSYDGVKTVTQIGGMATNVVLDDVYRITGRSKTIFNNGLTVVLDTDDPLIKKVACPWISEGTLKIKINDRALRLDFGFPNNGDCDNKALLTWNNGNNQRVIILP
jgi:hypothetical protein